MIRSQEINYYCQTLMRLTPTSVSGQCWITNHWQEQEMLFFTDHDQSYQPDIHQDLGYIHLCLIVCVSPSFRPNAGQIVLRDAEQQDLGECSGGSLRLEHAQRTLFTDLRNSLLKQAQITGFMLEWSDQLIFIIFEHMVLNVLLEEFLSLSQSASHHQYIEC